MMKIIIGTLMKLLLERMNINIYLKVMLKQSPEKSWKYYNFKDIKEPVYIMVAPYEI